MLNRPMMGQDMAKDGQNSEIGLKMNVKLRKRDTPQPSIITQDLDFNLH